jgi:methyl-accepting chemotaxis protein
MSSTVETTDAMLRGALLPFLSALIEGELLDLSARIIIPPEAHADDRQIGELLNRFLEKVNEDFRALAGLASRTSVAAASNSFILDGIAHSAEQTAARLNEVTVEVQESATGAGLAAGAAADACELTHDVQARTSASFATIGALLSALSGLRDQAAEAAADVAELVTSTSAIASIVDVINDISAGTRLLALNAAIEAARVGEHGRGFAVVAAEVRTLADSTVVSTKQIAKTIEQLNAKVTRVHSAVKANAQSAADVGAGAQRVRDDLGAVDAQIVESSSRVAEIAAAVEQQSTSLAQVSRNVEAANGKATESARLAQRATDLGLVQLSTDAYTVLSSYDLGSCFDRIARLAREAADEVETLFERLFTQGRLQPNAVFDTTYVELNGLAMRRLEHLFEISRAATTGFVPPKYRTSYDDALDEGLAEIVDRYAAKDPNLAFVCVVDINGFLTMHVKAHRQAITGDAQRDIIGNRVKRIFDDPVGLRCGRAGLLNADRVGKRASRAEFRRQGVDLRQPKGRRRVILQAYARDTGAVLNDVAVPIYVRGEHWGGIRFAYDPTTT